MIIVTRHGLSRGAASGGRLVSGQGHQDASEEVAWRYSIAGQDVVFQERVTKLQAFHEVAASQEYSRILNDLPELKPLDRRKAELFYQGQAPFDNEICDVACWRLHELLQISINGKACCVVSPAENHIHVLNRKDFDHRLNLEVVSGPAMMLLLANRGVYSLHASAVETPYGTVAFIAESGTGKSTLAAHQNPEWVQLADDQLPLTQSEHRYELFDYPQLKLADTRPQQGAVEGETLDLLIRLQPQPADEIRFRRLPRTEAMLQIIRHTVAARLLNKEQMRAHARFAKHLSGDIPLVELCYPRDLNVLAQVRDAITDYMQARDFT